MTKWRSSRRSRSRSLRHATRCRSRSRPSSRGFRDTTLRARRRRTLRQRQRRRQPPPTPARLQPTESITKLIEAQAGTGRNSGLPACVYYSSQFSVRPVGTLRTGSSQMTTALLFCIHKNDGPVTTPFHVLVTLPQYVVCSSFGGDDVADQFGTFVGNYADGRRMRLFP